MKKTNSLFLAFALVIFTITSIQSAQAALTISAVTSSPVTTSGGGSNFSALCTSPKVLSGISSYTNPFDGSTAVSVLSGYCATLATDGLTISVAGAQTLGTYGSSSTANTLAQLDCSVAGGNSVITGARVYKTPNGYAAGIQPQCGTLPNGASRSLLASTLGITTGTYEDIACNTGDIAIGLNVYSGGILDKFGLKCATLTGSSQPIVISSLGTSSKTYPYSQVLSASVTGTVGTGAVTYAITAGGTASGCSLSNTSSTATISATSYGTCLVAATIASDSNYLAGTSPGVAFTFNRGTQAALTITSTTGSYGTPLALTTSGGSGSGSVTYAAAAGTGTCTVSGSNLTATSYGTCLVTATKSFDAFYDTITSSQVTITFNQSVATASLTIAGGGLIFRQSKNLTVTTNSPGRVSLKVNNVFIPGCKGLISNAGNSYTVVCAYKPSRHGVIRISVLVSPTDSGFLASTTYSNDYLVSARTGTR